MADPFTITVEIVPPASADPGLLLTALESIRHVPFDAFSVATNPVARPHMSALAMCTLIHQRIGKSATL
ncbi:MAG TPA: homocysteine methyltransferase, partial [Anaerolineae bacterium]|nr:homocysteine methyltransferase [Anaerolineae bacterium]